MTAILSPRQDILDIQECLRAILARTRSNEATTIELITVFAAIGGLNPQWEKLAHLTLSSLASTHDLLFTESVIRKEFARIDVGDNMNMLQKIAFMLEDRAEKVFEQIEDYIPKFGRIIDVGCGDGQVTQLIRNTCNSNIDGFEVSTYRNPNVNFFIRTFDGRKLPVGDSAYAAAVVTDVLHDASENELLIAELRRIVRPGGRLIVIETTPRTSAQIDLDRTFIQNYVYNRLFHDADLSVPGAYETVDRWIERLSNADFELSGSVGQNPKTLGYDHPISWMWHELMVFENVK
jgi:ubiquinone/menaquinone biosynthesis C-methylase UbiE